MFKIETNIDNIQKIDKQIKIAEKMMKMKEDTSFQDFIKQKCMQTLQDYINGFLIAGSTTNDDSIEIYKTSNHIEDIQDGFVIYNNAKIPANVFGKQNNASNYKDGMFNLALAFEYGVGVIGVGTGNPKAWEYNINNYNSGWYLPKNVLGKAGIKTEGYKGFEIYRMTAIDIERSLPKWVNEYISKGDN